MRIWTVHPRYLDTAGLVAAWREGLLAQAVLCGQTRGYRHHPQLLRFRATRDPLRAISAYLEGLADEADRRGWHFDRSKIIAPPRKTPMTETRGQLAAEWILLGGKLARRNQEGHARWVQAQPRAHPLFRLVAGPVREWEKSARIRSGDTHAGWTVVNIRND